MESKRNLQKEVVYPIFPYEEYKRRWEKARKLMAQRDIDALILMDSENVEYFTGLRRTYMSKFSHNRIVVLPIDGGLVLAGNRVLRGIAMRESWVEDLRFWGGREVFRYEADPAKFFTETIKELGLANKVLGLETGLIKNSQHFVMQLDVPYNAFESFKHSLPNATFVDALDLCMEVRRIKSPREKEILRKGCDIVCKGYKAALEFARQGVTEREIARVIWETWIHNGAHDSQMKGFLHIRSGPIRYVQPCARPSDRKLQKGDLLLMDGGAVYNGYPTDFLRMLSVGEPADKTKEIYEASCRAGDAEIELLKNTGGGTEKRITGNDLYQVAYKELKGLGYENSLPDFAGHGLGMDLYEPPMLVPGDETVIEPGMFLAVELPLYDLPDYKDPLKWGVTEDNGVVSKKGYDNFCKGLERKLYVV